MSENSDAKRASAGKDTLRLRQQQQHLLALYLTMRLHARQLEEALLQGVSPTGYGAPLTPLPAEVAEGILAPVKAAIALFKDMLRIHAPEQLAEAERQQPVQNTLVWASNLLEQVRRGVEELAPGRLARYGDVPEKLHADIENVRPVLGKYVAEARLRVETLLGRKAHSEPVKNGKKQE